MKLIDKRKKLINWKFFVTIKKKMKLETLRLKNVYSQKIE